MGSCLIGTHCLVLALFLQLAFGNGGNVSYDSRSLIIDGQRKLLISTAIHYPRSVPAVSLSSISLCVFSTSCSFLFSLCDLLVHESWLQSGEEDFTLSHFLFSRTRHAYVRLGEL